MNEYDSSPIKLGTNWQPRRVVWICLTGIDVADWKKRRLKWGQSLQLTANFQHSVFGVTPAVFSTLCTVWEENSRWRQSLGGSYLNTRAPSRRPREMKSLLGLKGLSPLHSSKPSLAVVLNLMKAFDLDPDTLEEMHKGVHEINHQHLFRVIPAFPKQPDVEIKLPSPHLHALGKQKEHSPY